MDRHRIDPTHGLTPHVYTCPACGQPVRMLVVWPFWECPLCQERLIPADLYPVSERTPGDIAPQSPDQQIPSPRDLLAPPDNAWPQAEVRPD